MVEGESATRSAELSALLSGAPAAVRFRELLALFARWPATPDRARALDQAEAALAIWPDVERRENLLSGNLFANDGPCSAVRLVRALDVYRVDQEGHRFATLLRSGALDALSRLEINDANVDLVALAQSSLRLRELRLVNQALGEAARSALAQSPVLSELEILALVGTRGALVLLDAVEGGRLRKLVLSGALPVQGVELLLAKRALCAGLCELDLSANDLGERDAAQLAAASQLGQLRVLDLRRNRLITASAQALLRAAPQYRATQLRFG